MVLCFGRGTLDYIMHLLELLQNFSIRAIFAPNWTTGHEEICLMPLRKLHQYAMVIFLLKNPSLFTIKIPTFQTLNADLPLLELPHMVSEINKRSFQFKAPEMLNSLIKPFPEFASYIREDKSFAQQKHLIKKYFLLDSKVQS